MQTFKAHHMKKSHILLLSSFLITASLFAQDTTLNRILAAQDDSAKVLELDKYSYAFEDTDKEKYLQITDEILRIGKKLNYPYWIAMAWYNYGYIAAKEANDRMAIRNFDTAISYLKNTNRADKMAYCHLNIAAISGRLGNIDDKVSHLTEAIRLLENTEYKKPLIHVYNAMGVLFYNQDEYAKGFEYFKKGLTMAREMRDTSNQVESLHGIVNCLSSQSKFANAEQYGIELLGMASAGRKAYFHIHAHTALSELYRKWGRAKPTIEHAEKIIQYANKVGDVQYLLIGTMGIADGYNLAKNYSGSIRYYNKALQLGKEKEVVIQLDDIYKGLSDAHTGINDNGRALDYYKKYIQYRDSANNEKIKKASAELEIKYQTAEKEKALAYKQLQLAQKDLQLQKSRDYMYYTLAALALAILIAALFYLKVRYKRLAHEKEIKSIQQQKELQLLQALMQGEEKERNRIAKDLHDGVAGMLAAVKMHFSSIPSADDLLHTEGYQQGMKLLNEATQEIRKTSHNLMPEVLIQHGLDEALNRYCNSVNNSKALQIQYDSWGETDRFTDSFELSVYRIVQELINNIIKHSKATQAIVQLTQQDNLLSICIEDNGVGFSTANGTDGMGLRSLQSRIKAMNGKMEMQSSEQNGVSAYLEFDVSALKKEAALQYE